MGAGDSTSVHAQADECSTALLIIDMVSRWDYPDAPQVLAGAETIAPVIADLRRRCADACVPVIYANDNAGRWRSDWQALMADARAAGGPGAAIAEALAPGPNDYFVLKPMHSAFFGTPLQLLLQHLKTRHLILTGVTSDQCVLATASAAHMHRYEVTVPHDAVATQTAARNEAALRHFQTVLRIATPAAAAVTLGGSTADDRYG